MELQVIKLFCLLVVVSVVAAADQGGHGGHGGHDTYEYSPYHYEYNVDDDKEYLHFGQEEEDDGSGNVHGYYHVQLPDGRLQRVDYHVSGYSGYIADVSYDGEAHHPSNSHHGGHNDHGGHNNHGGHNDHGGHNNHGGHNDHVGHNVHGGHNDHVGHHSSGHFGGSSRLGKAVSVASHPVEEVKSVAQFVHQSSRQNSFGQSGHFGRSSRIGKADSFDSKPAANPSPVQTSQSSLITRKRIERPETFQASSSEQVNTFQKPATFFEFRDSKNQVQSFEQAQQEAQELRNSQQLIGNIQGVPQEVQGLQNNQRQIQDFHRIQQETQGLQNAQKHIKSLQHVQQEFQGLQNAQRQIQNVHHVQQEFQGLQSTQSHIKDLQQAEVVQRKQISTSQHEHRRFPSLIQHDLFEPDLNRNSAPSQQSSISRPVPSQGGGFPERLRGRVIQSP